jgi:DNA repair exonuclease SbcCD ATPase subunit
MKYVRTFEQFINEKYSYLNESNLDSLERELDKIETILDRVLEDQENLEGEIEDLEEDIEEAEDDEKYAKAEKLESKLDKLRDKMDSLEDKESELSEKRDKLRDKISKLKSNENYQHLNENKYDRQSIDYLTKFAKKNNTDKDDFDGASGIKTAVAELYFLFKGHLDVIGEIKWIKDASKDKLKTIKWVKTKWEDTDDEPTKYNTLSEVYIKTVEEMSKLSLKALDDLQSGKHSNLPTLFQNIIEFNKKLDKINRNWQKTFSESKPSPNSTEGHDEVREFRQDYEEKAKEVFLNKIKDPKIKEKLSK